MRPLVILLALAVALPFAAGQGSSPENRPGGPDDEPGRGDLARECRGEDRPRDCMEAYCQEHPEDRGCQRVAGSDCASADCAELSRACERAAQGDASGEPACRELNELDDIRSGSRHVRFELDAEGRQLRNFTVGGDLLLQSITYGDAAETFEVSRQGQRIRFESGNARLEIHDSPTGDFWFRSEDATLLLRLPAAATVSASPHGHLVDYDGRTAILAGPHLTFNGPEVLANGTLRFFSQAGAGPAGASEALANATARGHVGAQVALSGGAAQVTAFDDMRVEVTQPAIIHGNDTLRVLVDADLDQGRTIVLDIDPAILGGPELELRYFDIHGENQTEIVFRQATSLADVLDPTDDGGQPEYWIVEDAQGLHVMVSVPHWSIHVIELASVGQFLVQPSILLGAAAGIAGVGVAGAAMLWPRRRDDVTS